MPTSIKYTGTSPIWGTTIVGKPDRWYPGQTQDVSDADAALYLASGLGFVRVSGAGSITPPQAGLLASLLGRGAAAAGNEAMQRWHSGAGSTGSRAENVTASLKLEAESDFDAVSLVTLNYEAAAVVGVKALVAATATFSTASQDTRFRPYVGGVAYNAVRAATDAYGWNTVTWQGASTVNLPAAGSLAACSVTVSDWIPVPSVPREDGGARPLLLARAYMPGAATPYTFDAFDFNTYYNAASAGNRGRLVDTGAFVGDAIATLSSAMTLLARSPLMAPVFRFRGGVVSVAAVGDSITQGTGVVARNDWLRRACLDLSSPTRPVVPNPCGFAGQTSVNYLAVGKKILAAAKPAIAFYCAYSPNDLVSSTRSVQDALARVADFVSFCAANRIIPVIATGIPDGNLTAANDAYRRAINTAVRSMGVSGGFLVADFSAVLTDGQTPEGRLTDYYLDTLHPNDAGCDRMANVAKVIISRLIGDAV